MPQHPGGFKSDAMMKRVPVPSAKVVTSVALLLAIVGLLYGLSKYSYLLFHSLVELFSIIVAIGIFILAWHSRRFWESGYFLLIGIAYLFVGGIDALHTLAYEGMGVFPGGGESNLATQLWISARGFEGLSLLAAPLLIGRKLRARIAMSGYVAASALVLLSIFLWDIFPTCYVAKGEQRGLTTFKVVAEYVLCAALLGAVGLLLKKRHHFDKAVLRLLVGSIVITILSELLFTLYRDPYGPPNLAGHMLKLVSFYLIYKAVIQTALAKPYSLLFRDLKRAEESLSRARDELEERVRRRTAELSDTVTSLEREVRERQLAESRLESERQRLFSVLRTLPGYVILWGRDHFVRFANDKFRELFGEPGGRKCYDLFKGRREPCRLCPPLDILETGITAEWDMQTPGERAFRVWGYPFTDLDGTQTVLELGIEVTEQRRLESEVLRSAEAERSRIGQDLHDGLGQILSGVSCFSEVLHRKLSAKRAAEAADAARIESALLDALNMTRSLAQGLSPVGEHPRGLMVSLKELASNVESMFRITCEFICEEPVLVKDNIFAMHLYRIAQEATNNSVRHGKAKRIAIRLASSSERIILTIEDNGMGMPDDVSESKGMGMRIMKYRAHMMNASLSVEKNDGGGTTVACSIPMENGE